MSVREREYLLSEIVLGPEEEAAALRVLRSGWLSMGPETTRLEQEFASFISAKHVLATSNCTAALHLALLSVGVSPGSEVIVPALSFVATANAAIYCGARAVFADVESLARPCIDPADIERKISELTKAIVVMHYAGYPCRMDAVLEIGERHQIPIVEDAAHCAGSMFAGRACGTIGDVGCFSLFGNKNLPAGEGGFLVTNNSRIHEESRIRRSHGMTTLSWERVRGHASSYDVVDLGYNYRMPELSAAVAREQLGKLAVNNASRDRVFCDYLRELEGVNGLSVVFADSASLSPGSRHLFAILLDHADQRPAFMRELRERRVHSSIHYPPINSFSYYTSQRSGSESCPATDEFARRVVTLPFHPRLTSEDVGTICSAVRTTIESTR